MKTRTEFTIEAAIKIQTEQLEAWKLALLPEIHAFVVARITRDNNKAKSPYEIDRGVTIDNCINNLIIQLQNRPLDQVKLDDVFC